MCFELVVRKLMLSLLRLGWRCYSSLQSQPKSLHKPVTASSVFLVFQSAVGSPSKRRFLATAQPSCAISDWKRRKCGIDLLVGGVCWSGEGVTESYIYIYIYIYSTCQTAYYLSGINTHEIFLHSLVSAPTPNHHTLSSEAKLSAAVLDRGLGPRGGAPSGGGWWLCPSSSLCWRRRCR